MVIPLSSSRWPSSIIELGAGIEKALTYEALQKLEYLYNASLQTCSTISNSHSTLQKCAFTRNQCGHGGQVITHEGDPD